VSSDTEHLDPRGSECNGLITAAETVPHGSVKVVFNFYGDFYCNGFAVQHCRLELPRLYSLNRFFVKAMPHALCHADMTRATVGFDNHT
jgi:hypothetical protein